MPITINCTHLQIIELNTQTIKKIEFFEFNWWIKFKKSKWFSIRISFLCDKMENFAFAFRVIIFEWNQFSVYFVEMRLQNFHSKKKKKNKHMHWNISIENVNIWMCLFKIFIKSSSYSHFNAELHAAWDVMMTIQKLLRVTINECLLIRLKWKSINHIYRTDFILIARKILKEINKMEIYIFTENKYSMLIFIERTKKIRNNKKSKIKQWIWY